jgi:threonine synthase
VVNPDHYERMIHLSSGNPAVLRSIIHSEIISHDEACEAVKLAHGRYGAFLAPPTAVGYAAALDAKEEYLEDRGTIVLLGTSHPFKYSEAIKEILGVAPPPPAEAAAFAHDDPRVVLDAVPDATIPPDLNALRDILSIR